MDGAAGAATGSEDAADVGPLNEVLLRGRVSGPPEERALPSGDVIVSWRLVVARPPAGRRVDPGVRTATSDTFDCTAWAAGVRRQALRLQPDDVVEVRGALRRRFWRAGAGAQSRCEVEVLGLRRERPKRSG